MLLAGIAGQRLGTGSLLVEQPGLRLRNAAQLTPAIGEEAQRPLGGDAGIELAQAAGGGVARIDEDLFVALGLRLVQFFEIGAVHQHFAAYFQHLGAGPLSCSGMALIVRILEVTSSPVWPSPRVAACTRRPSS